MWQRYIDGQYRRPSGIVGRWIGAKMAQQHRPENAWTVRLLDVQPADYVLEIGFGPGIAIEAVAQLATNGVVAGVDFSPTMVAAAKRRNGVKIRAGKVDLRYGDVEQLPFADATFDKAYSIHSIYFWRDPAVVLAEIYRVLKPQGLLIMTILPKEKWNGSNGTPDCKPYTGDELKVMLDQVGFTDLKIVSDPNNEVPSNFSVIGGKA